ncbi:MAG TPA: ferrous iron transporter B [Ignavibacteriaceae bacterium]|nr:ferrous iron transporter B [Ignavibacteriaceae bacterium]
MAKSDIIEHKEKHRHIEPENPLGLDSPRAKVVLAGNPNVGKSLIFNYLSGVYVDVSNFPGTTVAITKGNYKEYDVYDTPGIYGVSSFNDEEKVAAEIILEADIIINVVNSLYLERDLFLTLQLIEMGKKVSVILNFADELKKRNIKINAKRLSDILGVEVINTSAVSKAGFEQLDYAIENARMGKQNEDLHKVLHNFLNRVGSQAEALLVAEGDEYISRKHGVEPGSADDREYIYIDRRNRVNEIVSFVEVEDTSKGRFFNLFGRLAVNPITGIPILLVLLSVIFFLIGDVVSQRIVNFTENTIGKRYFEYYTKLLVAEYASTDITVNLLDDKENVEESKTFRIPDGFSTAVEMKNDFRKISRLPNAETEYHFHNPFVRLFFGEFGVITMTITYLLFLLLPLVISFYIAMAMLEDSGYLPRLATMLDRTLNRIGLNGRAVIPILLGFGCVTMATITTRLLTTDKEKSIANAILQFTIPCSAQLAVISVLLSGAGFKPLFIYVAVIFTVMISISTFMNKVLKGAATPLLIDLPIMRMPKLDNLFKKTFFRTYGFMKEAYVWFFAGALLIGVLEITGLLFVFQDLLAPVTTAWLKLPKEAANAFVMGMVRRDFGAAGLFAIELTTMQITVAIITITLFVPCIASFMVMLKERGIKEGLIVWFSAWILAFFVGGLTAQIII